MKKLNLFLLAFAISGSMIAQPTWTQDPVTECKVFNPEPQPDETVSWNGSCKDGIIDGYGTLIWYRNGSEQVRHIGTFQNGRPHGRGKYIFPNGGGEVEGNFVQGVLVNLEAPYLKNLEVNTLSLTDHADLFVADGILKSLFYYALKPQSLIKGTLVLLPGSWETPGDVINNNVTLLQAASDSGLYVIIPSMNNNLFLDETALEVLNTAFNHAVKKYNLSSDRFVIGGFSLGGMNAIRYTELSIAEPGKTSIHPRAVYGIDPPLDLARLYSSFSKIVQRNVAQGAVNEAKDFLVKMNTQFGGSPVTHPAPYIDHSMYSKNANKGGNAKYLKNIPVRIYTDPDIDWWMQNRGQDYYDLNAIDQAAMINELKIAGNSQAEFINRLGKGVRLNGRRHPHSWSLVEPQECIGWILQCLKQGT